MTYYNNILLGQITKTSGFDGAVIVKLDKGIVEDIPKMESVFLEVEGRLVPFFIAYSEYKSSTTIKLKFEDYDSVEEINEFTGSRIFLTEKKSENNLDNSHNLIGYDVIVAGNKPIGAIIEIISNSGQLLLNILSSEDQKEILIPFHEHFIVSINNKKRIICMNIPTGLLEIN